MTAKRTMKALAEELEPTIRRAFLDAIADIKSSAILRRLVNELEAGNVEGVLRLLNLDPAYFTPLAEAVRNTFHVAGTQAALNLPTLPTVAGVIKVRWDGTNSRAAAWVADRAASLVTEIIVDQRDGIRDYIVDAFAEGKHPNNIALDIVGRKQPNGRRGGGILGLRSDQMAAASRMREELSGVPSLAKYRRRESRDKRFDRVIAKAEREGRQLSAEQIDKIVGRYEDIMLRKRGETIARTEALAATHKAQTQAVQQQIDSGKLDPRFVKKVWSATDAVYIKKKGHTRLSHVELNNTELPWGQPFVSPATGALMMHPGDTDLGAHGEDTINCRCHMYIRVDRYAMLRETELANG